jgi:hypothetical protein
MREYHVAKYRLRLKAWLSCPVCLRWFFLWFMGERKLASFGSQWFAVWPANSIVVMFAIITLGHGEKLEWRLSIVVWVWPAQSHCCQVCHTIILGIMVLTTGEFWWSMVLVWPSNSIIIKFTCWCHSYHKLAASLLIRDPCCGLPTKGESLIILSSMPWIIVSLDSWVKWSCISDNLLVNFVN